MAFSPDQHLRNLKGQQYLDVKWRLMWLREEHPDAHIKTELVTFREDQQMWVFKAEVVIPDKGSATGHGQETERDFPAGACEKAETKAIGRALAALGYGTQFAMELDEGDRVVDSPVAPTRAPRADRASLKVVAERPAEDRSNLKVVVERSAEDQAATLRADVAAALAADHDAASKLPKAAEEMTAEELEKTLAWLRNRAKRQA
jgi:hypothetical protein